jgi:hypothetical protein
VVPRRFALRAVLLAVALPISLQAQRVVGAGLGDDGWTLPAGIARIGLSTRFSFGDAVFDASGARVPLGAAYSRTRLDAATLPFLAAIETDVRAASGDQDFRLSLGGLRADIQRQTQTVPLEIALGLSNRLTVRLSAPLVATEHQTSWTLDPANATVGSNPALSSEGIRSRHDAFLAAIASSADALDQLATACLGDATSDPRCGAILADLSDVRSLTASSRVLSDLVARTYGGGEAGGAHFVPLMESFTNDRILAAIDALRTRYDALEVLSFDSGAGPVGAGAPATVDEILALLSDTTGSYGLGPFGRRYQQGLGDIDVGVWFRLYDGLGGDPWSRVMTPVRRTLRQTIGLTFRAGTGTPGDPDDPLMIATGDGQHDIEVTSATDLLWSDRLYGSVILRYTKQLADERIVRFEDPLLSPYLPLTRRALAERRLGDRVAVDISPRVVLNDYLAAGVRYRFVAQTDAEWTERAPAEGATALRATVPGIRYQEAGFGVTWSSIAAWRRGHTRIPIEVSYDRAIAIGGSGDVFAGQSDRISVTVYGRVWGR